MILMDDNDGNKEVAVVIVVIIPVSGCGFRSTLGGHRKLPPDVKKVRGVERRFIGSLCKIECI